MYEHFLSAATGKQWIKIGIRKRAGVALPLFSVYSKSSVGIGELPDLKLLIDWCQETGMSIIQLLPMNDTGFSFTPYDAQSGFALDPMYLSLEQLCEVNVKSLKKEISSLKKKFPVKTNRVNYAVKKAKLDLLWKIYETSFTATPSPLPLPLKGGEDKGEGVDSFEEFCKHNSFWLEDYTLFKVILEEEGGKTWESWQEPFRSRVRKSLETFKEKNQKKIQFQKWLQWQLSEQFQSVKEYSKRKGVLIMGDLPFLASRNSADVWSHPEYFKLNLSSGAPPDAYFAKGQRWGTPPCHWEAIEARGYDYLIERLKFAQNFYDLIRIDHVVGLFRLWSIPVSEPPENGGLNGFFDPADESKWEEHGRKILSVIISKSNILPCAEDLGTVPDCAFKVLKEFAVPGMDVQRWMRDLNQKHTFKLPEQYRPNSTTVVSTHDMTTFDGWWLYEAGAVYEGLFKRQCEERGIDFEGIKGKLFDLSRSGKERLRWKEEIKDIDSLIKILGKPKETVQGLISEYLASYQEKRKFWNYLEISEPFNDEPTVQLLKTALSKATVSNSIFSIQLIHDWLGLGDLFKQDPWETRINFPGLVSDKNWSIRLPISLEEMNQLQINEEIKEINERANRI